jgi:methanethiol S-methyltransferase
MPLASTAAALYGLAAYAVFCVTLLYAVGFVGNWVVPKAIDFGPPGSAAGEAPALSWAINVALLGAFAVQHSVMARPAFKRLWTRVVPKAVERSTYVLAASAALIGLFAQWRPIATPVIWDHASSSFGLLLGAASLLGWALVLISTFQIDHFELFGLKQALALLTRRKAVEPAFRTPLLYRHVRHPIYLGFLIAFWCTPMMTAGHLLFAAATTGYILIGIWFEERDLVALFGQRYRDYRAQVGMLWPRLGARRVEAPRRPAP